jgi:hypothetical protein
MSQAMSDIDLPASVVADSSLIHRVLLADPSDFSKLTISGQPADLETLSFTNFDESLARVRTNTGIDDISVMLKAAFRDRVLDESERSQRNSAVQELLSDLHNHLRALVPSRTDLHGLLQKESILQAQSLADLNGLVVQAAQALVQLESPARSMSTLAWLETAQSPSNHVDLSFVVTSILYLLQKAEQCQTDKQNFYLGRVWAPRIHEHGVALKRRHFEQSHGSLVELNNAKATKLWIQELFAAIPDSERKGLLVSPEARQALVFRGWIDEIVFRPGTRPPLQLPEVLDHDQDALRRIRSLTRLAVAGSALALHACTAAKQSPDVLKLATEDTPSLESRRVALVQAISEPLSKTPGQYQDEVSVAVINLSRKWSNSNSIDSAAEETLRGRTRAVLQAEDPVLQVLERRMKTCFSETVTWPPESLQSMPNVLQSGEVLLHQKNPAMIDQGKALFLERAKSIFRHNGLAFYASDLSESALLARKIIHLAWRVFGDALLDRLILQECSGT